MPQVEPYAKYFLPGAFFAEHVSRPLTARTVEAAIAAAPDEAIEQHERERPVVDFAYDAERFAVSPRAQNLSAKHYIDAAVFTVEELRQLAAAEGEPEPYRTLIANICSYQAGVLVEGRAVRCRAGNWQPFEDGDVVVSGGAS